MNEKEWWDRRGDGGRKGLIGLKTFFSNFIIILNKKRLSFPNPGSILVV